MNNWQKFGLGVLVLATAAYVKLSFFSPAPLSEEFQPTQEEQVDVEPSKAVKQEKAYVNIFFVGLNGNKEESYKAVKREYNKDTDGTKLHYAILNLVKGPSAAEKAKGIYSEIPMGTVVISLAEGSDKTVINLSNEFQNGGGTDSLYKRLFQLIKTAKLNTNKPVYLYIDGKQADVIGGEGLMINQPLNESSLDG